VLAGVGGVLTELDAPKLCGRGVRSRCPKIALVGVLRCLYDPLQLLRITFLPRILLLAPLNQRPMLLAPRLNPAFIRQGVAHNPRLKLDFRHHLRRLDVEYCERLRDGDEQRVVCYVASRADAAAVTKDEVARVGLRCVRGGCEETGGVECHRGGVDSGVVGKPPGRTVSGELQRVAC
jgi:hypothetical protein